MNFDNGEPQYGVVIHEMGHNSHQAPSMSQLLEANDRRFGNEFAPECIASFPLIYFFNEISRNGGQYGLGPSTFEWSYMHGHDGHSTPYGHEMIHRFLKIFGKVEIPDFQEDEVETHFAAAFNISAGSDERVQLRYWGFTIDDELYAQIEPIMAAILTADPCRIFKDDFEGGGASAIRTQPGK